MWCIVLYVICEVVMKYDVGLFVVLVCVMELVLFDDVVVDVLCLYCVCYVWLIGVVCMYVLFDIEIWIVFDGWMMIWCYCV